MRSDEIHNFKLTGYLKIFTLIKFHIKQMDIKMQCIRSINLSGIYWWEEASLFSVFKNLVIFTHVTQFYRNTYMRRNVSYT